MELRGVINIAGEEGMKKRTYLQGMHAETHCLQRLHHRAQLLRNLHLTFLKTRDRRIKQRGL